MKYHFKMHREKAGYWAECLELKGCVTQADTLKILQKNMEEVLNLYLDEPEDSKALFPLPNKRLKGKNIVVVSVQPHIAFSFALRRYRLMSRLTQRQAAQRLGFVNLYNYQRLESSKTANPALSTLVQLKRAFPDLDLSEVLDG